MRVWAAFRTHDSCNGCPWMLIGLATTEALARQLAEQNAQPYVPFGAPKVGPLAPRVRLEWTNDEDELVTDDMAAKIAAHHGEHYIVRDLLVME